jgi:hydrogenase nickel incorporation protein HypA/HybF
MHELSITSSIVAIACEQAGQRRIHAVHVRVGALTGVDVQALLFCYDLCAEGTVAAGSQLKVEHVPGAARCSECRRELQLSSPFGLCPCDKQALLERTAGDELLVTALEVEEVDDV